MPIVREGAKPRRELAVCGKVEVVKGARAERLASVSEISDTSHLLFLRASRILFTTFSSRGSSEQASCKGSFLAVKVSAVITQKFSGMKARISLSLSIMIRRAGDWTRPADSP